METKEINNILNQQRMKNWRTTFIVFCFIVFIVIVFKVTTDKPSTETPSPDPQIIPTKNDTLLFNSLINNFTYKEDEFKNIGWYNHKQFKNSLRECLMVNVRNDGFIYLVSRYYGDSWIFHDHIQVKIESVVYSSIPINSFDKRNQSDNSYGSVWETLHMTNDEDNGILKFIANNVDKKILVRFYGRQYYSDITLSKKDKEAIKDCVELGKLLKLFSTSITSDLR